MLPMSDGGNGPGPVAAGGEQVLGVEVGVHQLAGAGDGAEAGAGVGRVAPQAVLLGRGERVAGVPGSQAPVDEGGQAGGGFRAVWSRDQVRIVEEARAGKGDRADRGKGCAGRAAEFPGLDGGEAGQDGADQVTCHESRQHDRVARAGPVGIGGDNLGDRHGASQARGQGGFDRAGAAAQAAAQDVAVAAAGDEQDVDIAVSAGECPGVRNLLAGQRVAGEPRTDGLIK
jgi:hypothetical protein